MKREKNVYVINLKGNLIGDYQWIYTSKRLAEKNFLVILQNTVWNYRIDETYQRHVLSERHVRFYTPDGSKYINLYVEVLLLNPTITPYT